MANRKKSLKETSKPCFTLSLLGTIPIVNAPFLASHAFPQRGTTLSTLKNKKTLSNLTFFTYNQQLNFQLSNFLKNYSQNKCSICLDPSLKKSKKIWSESSILGLSEANHIFDERSEYPNVVTLSPKGEKGKGAKIALFGHTTRQTDITRGSTSTQLFSAKEDKQNHLTQSFQFTPSHFVPCGERLSEAKWIEQSEILPPKGVSYVALLENFALFNEAKQNSQSNYQFVLDRTLKSSREMYVPKQVNLASLNHKLNNQPRTRTYRFLQNVLTQYLETDKLAFQGGLKSNSLCSSAPPSGDNEPSLSPLRDYARSFNSVPLASPPLTRISNGECNEQLSNEISPKRIDHMHLASHPLAGKDPLDGLNKVKFFPPKGGRQFNAKNIQLLFAPHQKISFLSYWLLPISGLSLLTPLTISHLVFSIERSEMPLCSTQSFPFRGRATISHTQSTPYVLSERPSHVYQAINKVSGFVNQKFNNLYNYIDNKNNLISKINLNNSNNSHRPLFPKGTGKEMSLNSLRSFKQSDVFVCYTQSNQRWAYQYPTVMNSEPGWEALRRSFPVGGKKLIASLQKTNNPELRLLAENPTTHSLWRIINFINFKNLSLSPKGDKLDPATLTPYPLGAGNGLIHINQKLKLTQIYQTTNSQLWLNVQNNLPIFQKNNSETRKLQPLLVFEPINSDFFINTNTTYVTSLNTSNSLRSSFRSTQSSPPSGDMDPSCFAPHPAPFGGRGTTRIYNNLASLNPKEEYKNSLNFVKKVESIFTKLGNFKNKTSISFGVSNEERVFPKETQIKSLYSLRFLNGERLSETKWIEQSEILPPKGVSLTNQFSLTANSSPEGGQVHSIQKIEKFLTGSGNYNRAEPFRYNQSSEHRVCPLSGKEMMSHHRISRNSSLKGERQLKQNKNQILVNYFYLTTSPFTHVTLCPLTGKDASLQGQLFSMLGTTNNKNNSNLVNKTQIIVKQNKSLIGRISAHLTRFNHQRKTTHFAGSFKLISHANKTVKSKKLLTLNLSSLASLDPQGGRPSNSSPVGGLRSFQARPLKGKEINPIYTSNKIRSVFKKTTSVSVLLKHYKFFKKEIKTANSLVLKHNLIRLNLQKKRKAKKQRLETRRQKKRTRFFPRPLWLRSAMFTNFDRIGNKLRFFPFGHNNPSPLTGKEIKYSRSSSICFASKHKGNEINQLNNNLPIFSSILTSKSHLLLSPKRSYVKQGDGGPLSVLIPLQATPQKGHKKSFKQLNVPNYISEGANGVLSLKNKLNLRDLKLKANYISFADKKSNNQPTLPDKDKDTSLLTRYGDLWVWTYNQLASNLPYRKTLLNFLAMSSFPFTESTIGRATIIKRKLLSRFKTQNLKQINKALALTQINWALHKIRFAHSFTEYNPRHNLWNAQKLRNQSKNNKTKALEKQTLEVIKNFYFTDFKHSTLYSTKFKTKLNAKKKKLNYLTTYSTDQIFYETSLSPAPKGEGGKVDSLCSPHSSRNKIRLGDNAPSHVVQSSISNQILFKIKALHSLNTAWWSELDLQKILFNTFSFAERDTISFPFIRFAHQSSMSHQLCQSYNSISFLSVPLTDIKSNPIQKEGLFNKFQYNSLSNLLSHEGHELSSVFQSPFGINSPRTIDSKFSLSPEGGEARSEINYLFITSSALLHLCALITLVSISQVRCFVKFHLILLYKLSNTYSLILNQINFANYNILLFKKNKTTFGLSNLKTSVSLPSNRVKLDLQKRSTHKQRKELTLQQEILTHLRRSKNVSVTKSYHLFSSSTLSRSKVNLLTIHAPRFAKSSQLTTKNVFTDNTLHQKYQYRKTKLALKFHTYGAIQKSKATSVILFRKLILEFFQQSVRSIRQIFEKPTEFTTTWIANAFLVEWSSDLITIIPENIDMYIWNTFSKISRTVPNAIFLNTLFFKYNLKNVIFIQNLPILLLVSHLIHNRILHLFDTLVQSISQPDTDLSYRQEKGKLFWDIWADFLVTAADYYNVNVAALSTIKAEQNALIDNISFPKGDYERLDSLYGQSLNISIGYTQSSFWYQLLSLNGRESFKGLSKPYSPHLTSLFPPKGGAKKFINRFGYAKQLSIPFADHFTMFDPLNGRASADRWAVNQYVTYQSWHSHNGSNNSNGDLFIDYHPPIGFTNKNISTVIPMLQQPIGTLVCQIYSGINQREISKNILLVNPPTQEKINNNNMLLIQALAGETELKLVTDNAQRYALINRGFAIGIKLLRDVFDAIALNAPCIFLLEDIHAIGERRPMLISDAGSSNTGDDNSTFKEDFFGSQFAPLIHEKNQIVYQLTRHALTHYKKPFKGDYSLAIPTNLFVTDLFLKLPTQSIGNLSLVENHNLTIKQKIKYSSSSLTAGNHNQSSHYTSPCGERLSEANHIFEGRSKLKTKNNISYQKIKKNSSNFAPPSTSPFSVLLLKEEKKLRPNKIVEELPWNERRELEQLATKPRTSYSIRAKVAMLAELSLSNLSAKLDMITDLLVIIDSVRSHKGFVVFATTDVPHVLDPALRRPGRLDQAINLAARPFVKDQLSHLSISGLSVGNHIFEGRSNNNIEVLTSRYSAAFTNAQQNFETNKLSQVAHPFVSNQFFKILPTFTKKQILTVNLKDYELTRSALSNRDVSLNSLRSFKPLSNFVTLNGPSKSSVITSNISVDKARIQNVNFKQLKTNYHNKLKQNIFSQNKITSNSSPKGGRRPSYNHSPKVEPSRPVNVYYEVGKVMINYYLSHRLNGYHEQNHLTLQSLNYLSLFSPILKTQNTFKNSGLKQNHNFTGGPLVFQIMELFGGKIAQIISSGGNLKTRNQKDAKQDSKFDSYNFVFSTEDKNNFKLATLLMLSVIHKRYLYSKNLIVPKLLSFTDGNVLEEPPSPPFTSLLIPAKRFENYKRVFQDSLVGTQMGQRKAQISFAEKLQAHSQLRSIKLLKQMASQENEASLQKTSIGVNNLTFKALGFKTSNISNFALLEPTNINWYYQNRILKRHGQYLTNQWWTGQLSEHNAETVFLSDIDWRSSYHAPKNSPLEYLQTQVNLTRFALSPSGDVPCTPKGVAGAPLSEYNRSLPKRSNTPFLKEDKTTVKPTSTAFTNVLKQRLKATKSKTSGVSDPDKVYTEGVLLDFPDTDQYYNPRRRRWLLNKGYWSFWFNASSVSSEKILSSWILESIIQTYTYLHNNTELLDFMATKFIVSGYANFPLSQNSEQDIKLDSSTTINKLKPNQDKFNNLPLRETDNQSAITRGASLPEYNGLSKLPLNSIKEIIVTNSFKKFK